MRQSRAWILQAQSDYQCLEVLIEKLSPPLYCQAIAKSQQCVEKAVKGLIRGLDECNIQKTTIGYDHKVSKFVSVLIRVSGQAPNKALYGNISKLFSPAIQSDIQALERLTPKKPPPGQQPGLNTEYPFQDSSGDWRAPADATSFTNEDVRRYRQTAAEIQRNCARLLSALERSYTS